MDLREAGLLADAAGHWYYRAKAAALLGALGGRLPRTVLDIGAGSGVFSRHLLACPGTREAVCVDPAYDRERDERVGGNGLRFRRQALDAQAELVLMMDVLEHVPDDAGLLGATVAPVAAGTRFVLTVPAFGWLWSGHDEFLGHHRRYTLGELRALAERCGLVVERGCYLYALVFPLAAASRLAAAALARARRALGGQASPPRSQMRPLGRRLDGLLAALCRLERPLWAHNRLFGLTAMVVARKPA